MSESKSYQYKGYTIVESYYGWKVHLEGGRFVEFATDKQAERYIDKKVEHDD